MCDSAFWRLITMIKEKINNQSLILFQICSKKIQINTRQRFARCASSFFMSEDQGCARLIFVRLTRL